ncbi:MAG: hypothetical protein IPK32_26560 [Verrucomicrobiaceae bacterium]|nr:hypothetical protein [Verrucomicrobiaceae bacterium]
MKKALTFLLLALTPAIAAEAPVYDLGPPVAKIGAELKPHERIDELVLTQLTELGLKPVI